MSRVRGKNTKPEMLIRQGLHAIGFRYRLHASSLPGKPDLVFSSRRAVIFVHGCFWHSHDCPLFKLPGTRHDFWRAKIARNQERDAEVAARLAASGWRVLNIWECAVRGPQRMPLQNVIGQAGRWLCEGGKTGELRGAPGD